MTAGRVSEVWQHLFPSAAKTVTPKIERDSTGLTGSQKTALIAGWGIVKQNIYIHSKNIFVIFLDQYPKYLKYFDKNDDSATNIRENQALHAHSLNVMNVISTLIESGLHDPTFFEVIIKKVIRSHSIRNMYREDVKSLTDVIKVYILDVLEKQNTKTLQEAVEAFCARVVSAFDVNPNAIIVQK